MTPRSRSHSVSSEVAGDLLARFHRVGQQIGQRRQAGGGGCEERHGGLLAKQKAMQSRPGWRCHCSQAVFRTGAAGRPGRVNLSWGDGALFGPSSPLPSGLFRRCKGALNITPRRAALVHPRSRTPPFTEELFAGARPACGRDSVPTTLLSGAHLACTRAETGVSPLTFTSCDHFLRGVVGL